MTAAPTGYYPFKGEQRFVTNAWYVAAWSDEVTRTPLARMILGEPLLLYRDEAGKAVALEGLCPHRQYPLDKAWVEGDALRCPYHGMRFGPDGKCTQIPSQRDIPANADLRSYPLVEKWRWLWIWMGDANKADSSLIPDHDQHGVSEAYSATPCYRLEIDGRYQLLNENLLDLTHIAYLHQGGRSDIWVAGTDWPEEELETDPQGRWMRGQRSFALQRTDLPPAAGLEGGPAEMTVAIHYQLPSFFVGRQIYRGRAPGKENVTPTFINIHAFTPIDAHRTVYYFVTARNFAHGDSATTDAAVQRFRRVLDEDKVAIELIEPYLDRPGRRPDFVAKADRSAIVGRRMLQRMIDQDKD